MKETRSWSELCRTLEDLNAASVDASRYKLIYANRHGQGFHNVAEAEYGTADWDAYWSKLNGDGKITWGPDALLTPLGIQQAEAVNTGWKKLLAQKDTPPLPSKLFASPLSRALSTLEIAYKNICEETESGKRRSIVKEGFREHYGEHTCDQRRRRSAIHQDYPNAEFEVHFTEEDQLWTEQRESEDHLDHRVQRALEDVWEDSDDTVIGLTSHSGVMQSLFRVTHHYSLNPSTGAIIPLIIKGTPAG